eukprot:9911976-Alexandrium_andersonii.AAC.1
MVGQWPLGLLWACELPTSWGSVWGLLSGGIRWSSLRYGACGASLSSTVCQRQGTAVRTGLCALRMSSWHDALCG